MNVTTTYTNNLTDPPIHWKTSTYKSVGLTSASWFKVFGRIPASAGAGVIIQRSYCAR